MTANEKNSFFFFFTVILHCQPIIWLIKIQGIPSMKKNSIQYFEHDRCFHYSFLDQKKKKKAWGSCTIIIHPDQSFSNINVETHHLGISLRCREWFGKSGTEPKILHFHKLPGSTKAAGPCSKQYSPNGTQSKYDHYCIIYHNGSLQFSTQHISMSKWNKIVLLEQTERRAFSLYSWC